MKTYWKYIGMFSLLAATAACSSEWDNETPSLGNTLQIKVADVITSGRWNESSVRGVVADSMVLDSLPLGRVDVGADWVVSSYIADRYTSLVSETEKAGTRGTPIHSAMKLPTIGIAIYDSKAANFAATTALWKRVQAVNQNLTGSWSIPGEAVMWQKNDYKLSFLAFSPYPTNATGLVWASDGRTLDYTVPVDVTKQPDLCLATPITNRTNIPGSGNHVISLSLQHALTAVTIKASAHKVKLVSATVKNVKTRGTLDLNNSSVSWSNVATNGNRAAMISESVESVDMKDITATNGHLMMVPQTLDDAAILELIFDDLSVIPNKRVTKTVRLNTLSPNKWEAGKQVFYNLQLKTQFTLTLTPATIELDRDAGSYSTGIKYTTNNPNAPTVSANQGWISNIKVDSATGKITFDYSENAGKSDRTATITVTSGLTTRTVTIKQSTNLVPLSEEANCYIVAPSGSGIKFPVSIANRTVNRSSGAIESYQRIGNEDILTAEMLWQTTAGAMGQPNSCISSLKVIGVGNQAKVEVKPGAIAGSALIAVKVNGKVRWSWHIWVTAYNPNTTYKTLGGNQWMDRHLGALSSTSSVDAIGLFYQWGRKDPFTGMNSFTSPTAQPIYDVNGKLINFGNKPVPLSNNFENALENPTTYYYQGWGGSYQWDGASSTLNMKLWQSTLKTPYDPCPPGWRVPTMDEFGNLSSFGRGSNASNHSNLGIFPLTGNRGFQVGSMDNYGQMGFCWTTTLSGTDIVFLYCKNGSAQRFTSNRTSGCSTRCVKIK